MSAHHTQTTIVGSLPKPAWLAEPKKTLGAPGCCRARPWPKACATRCAWPLRDQEVGRHRHRRRRRADAPAFRHTLIEQLEGVDFENKKTVRIRNR